MDFTEGYASRAGVGSGSIGNLAAVGPSCVGPVAVQDVQDAGAVGGFHIVLVRSPDGLSVLCPRDGDPGAASVRAH